jgi:glycosyltransferase involved in cell wall biosynthesis
MTDPTRGSDSRRKVLFVCHNHPSVRPGGAENYAYEVFEHFRSSPRYEPVFLAKGGKPLGRADRSHDTYIAPVSKDPDDYFFYTTGYEFDWLHGSITDKDYYTVHFRKMLEALRPDVVHFQHILFLGYDAIRVVRDVLPDAAIVMTLHEYLPMCHRQGQLLRAYDNEVCSGPSPRRCHECFPDVSPQQFFYRTKFIQSHLALVDHFVSPSQFLADRFIEWGLPEEKLTVEANGRSFLEPPAPVAAREHRDRFAFFGQISPFKGVDVLIEAMSFLGDQRVRNPLLELLGQDPDPVPAGPRPHLTIHGANLELQEASFQRRIEDLSSKAADQVTVAGAYDWRQLRDLMAATDWVVIPSIWFENSPLVIQEAFHHGRPIICSDIGGMAEKVRDGVDGLHFRAGDPRSLADAISRAAGTSGLWESMRNGIGSVHTITDHCDRLTEIYDEAIAARSGVRCG